MSAQPVPVAPLRNVALDTSHLNASSTASVWDRISSWVSEHKAVVYTVAGVAVVVTSAGVVYYLSDSSRTPAKSTEASGEKRKSKKKRREEKKKAEEEKKAEQSKTVPGG